MARSALRIFYLFLAMGLTFIAIFLWGYAQFVRPGPLAKQVTAIIPPGSGLDAISRTLEQAQIIADPLVFSIGARLSRAATDLKAGEYLFPSAISPRQIIELLKSGKTVVRRLTIVEGLTNAQVVNQLRATDGLTGDIGILPREGGLLPQTYYFSYGDSRRAIIKRMRDAMQKSLSDLWAKRAKGLPLKTLEEALVLASIVEKETGVAGERPRVAQVFLNRLEKGMRLQSDPTVVYAVTGGTGPLKRSLSATDLKIASPYNTYVSGGLPPQAICNPGLASIIATLNPVKTDALYFVADGAGGHAFARTLSEHNRNVAAWRKLRKLRRDQARKTPVIP
jgi:UPF0755 protein